MEVGTPCAPTRPSPLVKLWDVTQCDGVCFVAVQQVELSAAGMRRGWDH